MDISKARTTKVTSVERVDSGLHKARQRAGSLFLGQLCYAGGWEGVHWSIIMEMRWSTFENAPRASYWTKDREIDRQIHGRVLCALITKREGGGQMMGGRLSSVQGAQTMTDGRLHWALMHFYAIGAACQQLECTLVRSSVLKDYAAAVRTNELRNVQLINYMCSTNCYYIFI